MTAERKSVADSSTHTTMLTSASTTSWEKRSSILSRLDTNDSSPFTTTSTAAPISSSGATSAILLTVV